MTQYWIKRFYYSLFYWPMRINSFIYLHLRAPHKSSNRISVHLGPGQNKYLQGWINVDANFISAKIDVWSEFSGKLPFRNESVDVFYSYHVVEHFHDSKLANHFHELFRCLKRGGIIRIGGPNVDTAARKLLEGDITWFSSFPDNRKSVGGRFANFILCRGEHLSILTRSYLEELTKNAGFESVNEKLSGSETAYPEVFNKLILAMEYQDSAEAPSTLVIEARKPF